MATKLAETGHAVSELHGVVALDSALEPEASEFAQRLNLPLLRDVQGLSDGAVLVHTGQRLELRSLGKAAFKAVFVETGGAEIERRIRAGRKQPLGRALGLHQNPDCHVLDATAGLGRDSLVLAGLGARVSMLERNPVLHAMLSLALRHRPDLLDRCTLLACQDAVWFLADYPGRTNLVYDVIYLDPMYSEARRRALPKKEMQLLRGLLGNDDDADRLLTLARTAAKRVVVKRAPHALPLADLTPAHQIISNRVRYDVYLG